MGTARSEVWSQASPFRNPIQEDAVSGRNVKSRARASEADSTTCSRGPYQDAIPASRSQHHAVASDGSASKKG
eukprot:609560-Rhodomonas_salina.1